MAHSSEVPAAIGAFAITLKGWRSQLRWAMTQREEDPARVWLEIISIDERLKIAERGATDPIDSAELARFRAKLEESKASLTEELGDEKVAPLYSWLDLVRQRRKLVASVDEARAAVKQARALRAADGTKVPRTPKTDDDLAEQLAHAQGELAQWKAATLPPPPAEVLAVWQGQGGDALAAQMPRDAMAVGRRGDAARRLLESAQGRAPGKHPWPGSKGEKIAIAAAASVTLVLGALGLSKGSGLLGAVAALAFGGLVAVLAFSFFAREQEKAETKAAIDWVWHATMYAERTGFAELEAGWLRALADANKALRSFDAKPATGGQLRDFEEERTDLGPIVHEVARDTDEGAAAEGAGAKGQGSTL